jgi:ABC-type cobalamin/Fe3+-siderophores transport system ATPase subunit
LYKIIKIEIEGFKSPSRNLTIEFSKEPVSIIFGENGCGKTTLLRIIHAIISQNSSILYNENVEKIDLYYTFGNPENIKKVTVKKKEELDIQTITESSQISFDLDSYDWSEFLKPEFKEASSILFGTNRGISSSSININPDIIMEFLDRSNFYRDFRGRSRITSFAFELSDFLRRDIRRKGATSDRNINLREKHLDLNNINMESIERILIERYRLAKKVTNERVQKALFDTLSVALSVDSNEIGRTGIPEEESKMIIAHKERLIEALSSSPENALRDQLIKVLKSEKDFSRLNNSLLPSLLLKMTLELQSEKTILNSIDVLEKVFNDHVRKNEKKLVVTYEGVYIQFSENRHSLSELSSGEKHLLTLLTLFIIEGSQRNFIMIDEPEISLNIKWQRKLLMLLNELAPDSQIIVASHSPSLSVKNTKFLVEMD